jgi:hypothetical protein
MKRQWTAVSTVVLWEWRDNELKREKQMITYEAPVDRSEHGSIVGMEG